MGVDVKQFGTTTLSALQASVTVLLILGYGYYLRRSDFVDRKTENGVSKLCVKIFLPCLLFSQIGPLATPENLESYWIVVVLSLAYQLISWLFGFIGVKLFGFPQWIVPCMIFNNATSLPLLLLQALGKIGTLKSLVGEGEEMSEVLARGKVYLLINALVSNLVRFAIGPYMLEAKEDNGEPFNPQLWLESTISEIPKSMPELPEWDDHTHGPSNPQPDYPNVQPYPSVENNETSPLLNKNKAKAVSKGVFRAAVVLAKKATSFMNPPMWGGVLAIISGLIPWLRHSLFDDSGALSAFEQSVENLGDLYTSLQTLILGSQLYSKAGHRPPVGAVAYLFLYRFFIVTGVSCGLVVASRKLLGDYIKKDPILDFMLILAPTGPSALSLAAIVSMSDASEETASVVAQTLLVSHIATPLISLTVSAALVVVQALHP
ncbi:hypothetical protein FFLO_00128 [Filobasidium floriforme]|uniref:Auxin efflux carrier n=1 Tax=Filobasidium floriforme TaxID=5210 RepID=A0A8K0JST8_9TREE|nr:hypothetical protein FFLO_00128 [Filobasidium floriforme]